MRVTTVPDNEIWAGATRIVMGPPEGHDPTGEIRALEMLAEIVMGHRAYSARCVLEEGDLETLQAGGVVWLTFYGGVAPFSITVAPAAGTGSSEEDMSPAESSTWRCETCGSHRWVGWRAGPAHEGYPRRAQCVPCGHVQDLPKEDPDD